METNRLHNPKFSKLYRGTLQILQSYSTCSRLKVAAILVKDNKIISNGYNGTASGEPHCCDIFPQKAIDRFFKRAGKLELTDSITSREVEEISYQEYLDLHKIFSDKYEIHAEDNCLSIAVQEGIDLHRAIIYCTYSPCINCAKLIYYSGVKEVYFIHGYDRSISGIEYLRDHGVTVMSLDEADGRVQESQD